MFEIHGQHNSVKVMLPPGNIDEATLKQLKGVADFKPFENTKIVVMPDCHAGKGCCVGLTMKDHKVVVPNLVGVDIGCGIYLVPLPKPLETDKDFQRFDRLLRQNIPSGFGINLKQVAALTTEAKAEFEALGVKVGGEPDKVINALGSLGGGNHMIEIDQSPSGQQIMIIHSGSRNLGARTCAYHQDRAKAFCDSKGLETPGGLEYLPFGDGAEEYLDDMLIAQRYALVNRVTMARRLLELYFGEGDLSQSYNCTHNYIADGVIRKGAISAKAGERVLIPLNMRDGIVVGTGKGSEDWNVSAPHGAGRVYSRGQAKRHLQLKDFQNTMKGIWTSSVSKATLDESPMSYKPQKLIIEAIKETVEIEAIYKPVYNFKAE